MTDTRTHYTDEQVEAALSAWYQGAQIERDSIIWTDYATDMRAALEAASLAAPIDDRAWFWRVVDYRGLADLPSDEVEALRLILTKEKRLSDEVTQLTARVERAEAEVERLTTPRPLDEYHEDYGPVLWFAIPIQEPPYVGWPGDDDWPDYHTHWTPLPDCNAINKRARAALEPRNG